VARQADRLRVAKNPRECLEDLYRQAEVAYQSPIAITICFERELLCLSLSPWGSRRIVSGEFDCLSVAAKGLFGRFIPVILA
jgi:hypothetical protein